MRDAGHAKVDRRRVRGRPGKGRPPGCRDVLPRPWPNRTSPGPHTIFQPGKKTRLAYDGVLALEATRSQAGEFWVVHPLLLKTRTDLADVMERRQRDYLLGQQASYAFRQSTQQRGGDSAHDPRMLFHAQP